MARSLLAVVLVISIFSSICNCQTNNNVKCLPSDRKALLDFKDGLNDPENTLSSWQGVDCCSSWRGISCDNITGGVTVIDLHRYGFGDLSGEIRPSLIQLKSLTHLDLSSNTFEGIQIPEFFGSLKNLRYLNLSNAGFSGIIPPTLGNLSNLHFLDVSNLGFPQLAVDDFEWITSLVSLRHLEMNRVDLSLVNSTWLQRLNTLPRLKELHLSACGLSGSISYLSRVNFTLLTVIDLSFNSFSSMFPTWLVNITTLVDVDLSNCKLRGRIPLVFGELPNLRFFNLALNVHGKIPRSIGNMTSLVDLDFSNNNVDGGVPSTIGSLCQLVNFDVSGNNLAGTLPLSLEGTENCKADSPLPSLVHLRLSNNQLHGRLPDWLGELTSLEELSLAFNFFEGTLPSSLGSLQNLTDLSLAGNRLNGTLPQNIGPFPELVVFDVSSNYLTGILSEVHFSNLRKLKILRAFISGLA
ncbi:hypothetical protein BUALT_Bualt19G0041000 [Buddleja alternifolia]|uniref:Leucine-rich repeat-containing N-terminal plant-type domain-containing protein n=1 Tax=Buddleja alternifolia TaxID=168488 RepID=A0AAV6W6Z2_9LAMI|nr:hypothetical protein BUALT_Bualt19G0041000 [Buddleja alternifolia]